MKQSVILTKLHKLEKEHQIYNEQISFLYAEGSNTAFKLQAWINLTKKYWWLPMSSLLILSNKVLGKEMDRLTEERMKQAEQAKKK